MGGSILSLNNVVWENGICIGTPSHGRIHNTLHETRIIENKSLEKDNPYFHSGSFDSKVYRLKHTVVTGILICIKVSP